MKYLFLFFTIFTLSLNAQEYTYSITQQDSTFTLDIITDLSEQRQDIQRTTGLDSAALQQLQYSRIEQRYNDIAAAEQRIFSALRQISSLRGSLNDVGLHDYNAFQYAKYDSLFASDLAVWATNTGVRETCYIQYREGATQAIRRTSDNEVVGVILPLSPNYILVNILPNFQLDGVDRISMSSTDSRDFRGVDANGVSYRLRIINQ
jgi:hypothetical protein